MKQNRITTTYQDHENLVGSLSRLGLLSQDPGAKAVEKDICVRVFLTRYNEL